MPTAVSFSGHLRPTFRLAILALLVLLCASITANSQDTMRGAFQGMVTDSQSGASLRVALLEIIKQQTSVSITVKTNYRLTLIPQAIETIQEYQGIT